MSFISIRQSAIVYEIGKSRVTHVEVDSSWLEWKVDLSGIRERSKLNVNKYMHKPEKGKCIKLRCEHTARESILDVYIVNII